MEATIHLMTQEVSRLAKFFTQIFDVELQGQEEQKCRFAISGNYFQINYAQAEVGSGTVLELRFPDPQDVEDLYQKAQFASFRENLDLEFSDIDQEGFFLTDPDGRVWKVAH